MIDLQHDDVTDAETINARLDRLEAATFGPALPILSAAETSSRCTDIRQQIAVKREARTTLEAEGGDLSAGRSPQAHVLGGYQAAQHDSLSAEIATLERELRDLEG